MVRTISTFVVSLVTLGFVGSGPVAGADLPHLLSDIVSGPDGSASSGPSTWTPAGDLTYFRAHVKYTGSEIFVTDGTTEGTHLLADSAPGGDHEPPRFYGLAGGRMLWWAPTAYSASGFGSFGALWTSDGTPAGTERLLPVDVRIPDRGLFPRTSDFAGGTLYFVGCDPVECSLWRSDGTRPGTRAVHRLPGERGADELVAVGERIFFVSDGGLWALGPGGEGVLLVKALDRRSPPEDLAPTGATLSFRFEAPGEGLQIWTSDGTPEGTRPITNFHEARPVPPWQRVVGSALYFLVNEGVDAGTEIWRTEGTPESTLPVTAFEDRHALSSSLRDREIAIAGERVFVIARHSQDPLSRSIWVSDGTPGTTRELLDCEGGCPEIQSPLASVGDRALFVLGVDDRLELWSSDGTTAGTGPLAELCSGPCATDLVAFSELDQYLGFVASDTAWITDGTSGGTRPITSPQVTTARSFGGIGRVGDCWLFAGEDHRGAEPWCSEGSPGTAHILADIELSPPSSEPREIVPVGDRVVFRAFDEHGVFRIWSSDANPGSVTALEASRNGSSITDRKLVSAGGFALFDKPGPTDWLWRTDGTREGTFPVGSLFRFSDVTYDGQVYSSGYIGDQAGIWEIDGTPGGPRLTVPLASNFGFVPQPVVVGGAFYFRGNQDDDLWRSDGTPEGTWKVGDIPSEGRLLEPLAIAELRGSVFFVVDYPGMEEDEIWRTEGAPGSAVRAVTIPPYERELISADDDLHAQGGALYFGCRTSDPLSGQLGGTIFRYTESEGLTPLVSSGARNRTMQFTSVGEDLFFAFDDGVHGIELWRSDGTPAGTHIALDIHPGGFSYPTELTAAGDRLFFSAGSDRYGRELWVVEPKGEVRLVADIFPGAFSSDPRDLTVAGNTLFFSADDGETGREPWALPLGDLGPPPPPPGPFLTSPAVPGFRFKVRISSGAGSLAGRQEPDCIPETLCVSGALPGRSEAFLRVVGPKPNGLLWPTLVKFSTSRVEVWIEQVVSGRTRYYDLPGAAPGLDVLPGLFDRQGFEPSPSASAPAPVTGAGGEAAPAPAESSDRLTSPALPGFTFRVEITDQQGQTSEARIESDCIEETVCLSGALPGRSELFLRVVGPKPNGRLWPTLVRFSTSTIDVWLTQTATGQERHYRLEGASPGSTDLSGLFDRTGYLP